MHRMVALALLLAFHSAGADSAADEQRLARYTTTSVTPDPEAANPLAVVATVRFPRERVPDTQAPQRRDARMGESEMALIQDVARGRGEPGRLGLDLRHGQPGAPHLAPLDARVPDQSLRQLGERHPDDRAGHLR